MVKNYHLVWIPVMVTKIMRFLTATQDGVLVDPVQGAPGNGARGFDKFLMWGYEGY